MRNLAEAPLFIGKQKKKNRFIKRVSCSPGSRWSTDVSIFKIKAGKPKTTLLGSPEVGFVVSGVITDSLTPWYVKHHISVSIYVWFYLAVFYYFYILEDLLIIKLVYCILVQLHTLIELMSKFRPAFSRC